MNRKKWAVRPYNKESATMIAEKLNINPYAALIASTRGIDTVEKATKFFGTDWAKISDPMDFPDMFSAVKRIQKALDNFERIAVYGDYDCDGVTATALLYSYLEMQGADVVFYVPNRHTEGYGLGYEAIDKISRMGVKLIITVDNGISAVDEAEYISQLEMDLIITDHHLPGEKLPRAVAVVDPHRAECILDFKDYAGVGVAYKLICALEGEENDVTESYIDLVAMGTIADVMPLSDENRDIVRRGVKMIEDSERVGIRSLMDIAALDGKAVTSKSVAFGLVPRINAAGRMGSAERAVRLLLSEDYDEANEISNEINEANNERKQTETQIFTQAVSQINDNPSWEYDNVIVVSGEGWHDGVIGIVASRIVEKYGKPAFVITVDGDKAKGSGRSLDGFNLYEAISSCNKSLTHFGGHTLAAGIGLEAGKIDEFRREINDYSLSIDTVDPVQWIDFKINPAYANVEILDAIEALEPFGAGNPQPVFGLYNIKIKDIRAIGNGNHLRMTFTRDGVTLTAVKFRTTQAEFPFEIGDVVDIAAIFQNDEYMGQIRLSIIIKNIKFHDTDDNELFDTIHLFNSVMRNRCTRTDAKRALPDRELTVKIYKFIRSSGRWNFDIETLCNRINVPVSQYAMAAVSVEALTELGVVIRDENGGLTLPKHSVKTNLDDAEILVRIREIIRETV